MTSFFKKEKEKERIRFKNNLHACACDVLVVTTVSYYDMAGRNVMGLLLVKRLLPISPADRRKVGEFVFRQPIVPAPGNVYVARLRFKLGGRPVLSARFNIETARSERKRPEI
jgi:hypothetical protein